MDLHLFKLLFRCKCPIERAKVIKDYQSKQKEKK